MDSTPPSVSPLTSHKHKKKHTHAPPPPNPPKKKQNAADLMDSTFGLAPRGYAITSHRLLELLSVNVIPVILQVRGLGLGLGLCWRSSGL